MEYRIINGELYHYGLKGMKWGTRRWQYYDGRFNEAGKLRYFGRSSSDAIRKLHVGTGRRGLSNIEKQSINKNRVLNYKNKRSLKKDASNEMPIIQRAEKQSSDRIEKQARNQMTERVSEIIHSDKFKTAMKITAAAVTVYAATKVGKHFLRKYALNIYRESYDLLPNNFKSLSSVPKAVNNYYSDYFSGKKGWKSLTQGINHGVNESNFIKAMMDGSNRTQNCTFCSASIIMRLKGYETTAATIPNGLLHEITDTWFKGAKTITPKARNTNKLYNTLLKQGEGSYGTLNVFWKQGGGHSIVYTIKNGAVEIIDGQVDKSYGNTIADLNKNLFDKCNIKLTEVCNLTNCPPTEYVLKAIM